MTISDRSDVYPALRQLLRHARYGDGHALVIRSAAIRRRLSSMSDPSTDAAYVADLRTPSSKIWEIARRMGLDPYPVHSSWCPPTIMYEFGAYGLPGRFTHWSHGKAYHRMKTKYDYGLSKIYELVINTNPSYAFLWRQNDILQNKLVVAHVLGHTDFFKNNVYFKHTPPT